MPQPGSIYHMFVYILLCSDGSYYTGVTNNVEARLNQHQWGIDPDCYTYSRRPVQLQYWEGFQNALYAITWEKKIKKWSKKKKEALINNAFSKLPELSRKKFEKLDKAK